MSLSFKDRFDYGYSGRLGPPTTRQEEFVETPIREKRMIELAELNYRATEGKDKGHILNNKY